KIVHFVFTKNTSFWIQKKVQRYVNVSPRWRIATCLIRRWSLPGDDQIMTMTSHHTASTTMTTILHDDAKYRDEAERPEDKYLGVGPSIAYGLQHVLTMYGGIVAVPLIIGQAAGLPPAEIGVLIAAALFMGGLATLVQTIG